MYIYIALHVVPDMDIHCQFMHNGGHAPFEHWTVAMFQHPYLDPRFVPASHEERMMAEQARQVADIIGEGLASDALRNAEQLGGWHSSTMQIGGPNSLPMVVQQQAAEAAHEHGRRQAELSQAASVAPVLPSSAPAPTADDSSNTSPYRPRHGITPTPPAVAVAIDLVEVAHRKRDLLLEHSIPERLMGVRPRGSASRQVVPVWSGWLRWFLRRY